METSTTNEKTKIKTKTTATIDDDDNDNDNANDKRITTSSTAIHNNNNNEDKTMPETPLIDKDDNSPPPVPHGWTRCQAYNERKRRFCRQSICPRVPSLTRGEGEGVEKNSKPGNNNMTPIYCGNHWHLYNANKNNQDTNQTTSKAQTSTITAAANGRKGKRIPCPLDPSHYIYESTKEKHLKICPVTKLREEQEMQAYYKYNVNTGGHGAYSIDNASGGKGQVEDMVKRAQGLALRILAAYYTLFGPTLITASSTSSTTKVNKSFLQNMTYAQLYHCIPTQDLSSSNHNDKKFSPANQNIITSSTLSKYKIKIGGPKHLYQIQSILSHILSKTSSSSLEEEKEENSEVEKRRKRVVLEMGAGRGMLGLIVAGVLQQRQQQQQQTEKQPSCNESNKRENIQFVMVERAGSRAKADTVLRQAQKKRFKTEKEKESEDCSMDLKHVELKRIKCDLAHVYLPFAFAPPSALITATNAPTPPSSTHDATESITSNVPATSSSSSLSSSVTVIAKHLCGAGTDLALKSLKPLVSSSQTLNIDSVVMSTCCHGLCTHEHYVGRDYLNKSLQNVSIDEIKDEKKEEMDNFELGQVEFDWMKRWSAGSTMGCHHSTTSNNDDGNNNDNIDDQGRDNSGGKGNTSSLNDTASQNKKRRFDHNERKDAIPLENNNNDENEAEHVSLSNNTKEEDEDDPYSVTSIVKSLSLSCGSKGLGRACQRLIDYGRKCYIEEVLFGEGSIQVDGNAAVTKKMRVEMFHYVEEDVTPQNALILAYNHN